MVTSKDRELGIQVFDDEFADEFEFDVLDATKLIPEEQVPVRRVGRLVLDRTVDNFFAETEQVAFHTGNVVPGIDFSADPLLQGRNFSYLDTQLKRLGSPNFTHLPVNAPQCPVMNFQQDGHMAMHNLRGRANYEPNSWGEHGGPRENPVRGLTSYPEPVAGEKQRVRSDTFADHYSQARQFFISQDPIEQKHIADALTFELSKCQELPIRMRVVSHLRNVDEDLATAVADGLGLSEVPPAAVPVVDPRTDLPASPALSILANGPDSFRGRKLGILATDGADASVFNALVDALTAEGAQFEVIGPTVGGVALDDDTHVVAQQKIAGGPSVLYDAVAVLASEDAATQLAEDAAARDFVTDAFAHTKFIAYTAAAMPLFARAGIDGGLDAGCVELDSADDAEAFVATCRSLRHWERELEIDQTP